MEKFEPAKSEDDLEKRGLELLGTNQLWAGLVFVDLKEGSVYLKCHFTIQADV